MVFFLFVTQHRIRHEYCSYPSAGEDLAATKIWVTCWALVLFSRGNKWLFWQVSFGALVKFPLIVIPSKKAHELELCPKVVTLSCRDQLLSNSETKTAGSVRNSPSTRYLFPQLCCKMSACS